MNSPSCSYRHHCSWKSTCVMQDCLGVDSHSVGVQMCSGCQNVLCWWASWLGMSCAESGEWCSHFPLRYADSSWGTDFNCGYLSWSETGHVSLHRGNSQAQDAILWGITEGKLLMKSLERRWLTLSKYMKSCHSWDVRVTPCGNEDWICRRNSWALQEGKIHRHCLPEQAKNGLGSPQEIVTPLPLHLWAHSSKGHMWLGWTGMQDLGKMTAGPRIWHHTSDYNSLPQGQVEVFCEYRSFSSLFLRARKSLGNLPMSHYLHPARWWIWVYILDYLWHSVIVVAVWGDDFSQCFVFILYFMLFTNVGFLRP